MPRTANIQNYLCWYAIINIHVIYVLVICDKYAQLDDMYNAYTLVVLFQQTTK